MAESEYLDSSKARRWQSVAQAIRDGRPAEDVAFQIKKCLHKTLRQIRKDLPLGDLIRSLHDPDSLRNQCDQIDGAHDVKYFLGEAAATQADPKQQVQTFVEKSLDNCLYDIPWMVADGTGELSVSEARSVISSARSEVQREIERIAEKLSKNSDWQPRRSCRRYRSEWTETIRRAESVGCKWTKMIDLPPRAA